MERRRIGYLAHRVDCTGPSNELHRRLSEESSFNTLDRMHVLDLAISELARASFASTGGFILALEKFKHVLLVR